MRIDLVTVLVDDYDAAIMFYVGALGMELEEDSPSSTSAGEPKRRVVVRPPGGGTGLLLTQPVGETQETGVGAQTGGRVGFFLHVDHFDEQYTRMVDAGVEFLGTPRSEPYGRVVVFRDISGNSWDLLGPRHD